MLPWVQDAVFYQIFPDRFAKSSRSRAVPRLEPWESPPTPHGFKGGDLWGAAEKLDYLRDLGVTAVYLTPIFASAANHRYHTCDYLSVDPLLGGNAAFEAFLKGAHRRGMRVLLDGVFNHAGRGFFPFHHAVENGPASPYFDWFHFDRRRLKAGRRIQPYPSGRGPCGYKAWWGLPALPKLNTDHPAVRAFIFRVAEHWLEAGIDGWRLDVPNEIDDDAFWREFRRRVKAVKPEAYIVGEIWGEAGRWLKGDQFDATMNYSVTKAVLSHFCDRLDASQARRADGYKLVEPLGLRGFASAIDRVLARYPLSVNLHQLNLLGSHDTPRFLTLAGKDETALRLAAVFMFCFPGVPCVYYGDEIGMQGGRDPDCRRAFPWEPSRWNRGLLEFFKQLISLRRSSKALRRGSFERLWAKDGVYAFRRLLGRESAAVLLNLSRQAKPVPPALSAAAQGRVLFSDGHGALGQHKPFKALSLPPRSSLVLG
ncbi:MAG: DUF3459 domain-containing protein [Elusimicrobia bacterium]|nr:DUF3459 domain-containing protein [Elusimicrobiota bacterium]